MSIKINTLPNTSLPNQSDTEIGKKPASADNNIAADFENSSANSFYALEGQMRKLQLLRQFSSADISTNKPNQANFAVLTKRLGGTDDETLKETQRLIDNYRRQIKPKEVKGAQPAAPGTSPGHAYSGHNVKREVQAEIMNNPERVFSGLNDNKRYVDIYTLFS